MIILSNFPPFPSVHPREGTFVNYRRGVRTIFIPLPFFLPISRRRIANFRLTYGASATAVRIVRIARTSKLSRTPFEIPKEQMMIPFRKLQSCLVRYQTLRLRGHHPQWFFVLFVRLEQICFHSSVIRPTVNRSSIVNVVVCYDRNARFPTNVSVRAVPDYEKSV